MSHTIMPRELTYIVTFPTVTLIPFMQEQTFLEETERLTMWEREEIICIGLVHWHLSELIQSSRIHQIYDRMTRTSHQPRHLDINNRTPNKHLLCCAATAQRVHDCRIYTEVVFSNTEFQYQPASWLTEILAVRFLFFFFACWETEDEKTTISQTETKSNRDKIQGFLIAVFQVQLPPAWAFQFYQLCLCKIEYPWQDSAVVK